MGKITFETVSNTEEESSSAWARKILAGACACERCGTPVKRERAALGYRTCLPCGERAARDARMGWCVAPMHKSNYVLVTDRNDLKGLNNKGGLVK